MSAPVYDNHTPRGRAKIDRAVLRKMGRREWTRGLLANALPGLTARMVSDSLRRLVAQLSVERVNSAGDVDDAGRVYRKADGR